MPPEAIVELDAFLGEAQPLSEAERKTIVRQALRILEDYYVHLVMKRAIHGVDPVRRLRNLLADVNAFGDTQAFHEEVLSIFTSVRDLHTAYKLPEHFHQRAAVLPFSVEEYFEGDVPRIVVSSIEDGWERLAAEASGAPLRRGAVVETWNGLPVQRAIALNADRQGGCNPAARHARGLSTLTDRPLSLSPAPQERFVRLEFTDSDAKGTVTCRWRVIRFESLQATNPARVKALGVDMVGEAVRRTRKTRFYPELVADEPASRERAELRPPLRGRVAEPELEPAFTLAGSAYRDALQYRTLEFDDRKVGHLRIRSFAVEDTDGFVGEVRRILALLPSEGLILDVRGNGGGVISSGEAILQLFTPRHVHPQPLQLRTTDATWQLSQRVDAVESSRASLERAIATAEVYADPQPLAPDHDRLCNATGQYYRGPVVLIVDALCYSTTDIFAAGFQDHGIGKVIGVDATTGAGGANVWDFARLREAGGPDAGFESLPDGTDLRVALRRTLRVERSAGMLVEEFGITPDDEPYRMQRADVLEGNRLLLAHAASVLRASRPAFGLDVRAAPLADGRKRLTIRTSRLTRLDIYLNGRPMCASIDIDTPDEHTTTLEITARNRDKLQIFGYDARGGPVTEAAGNLGVFSPIVPVAVPVAAAPVPAPPTPKEDAMAELPFPEYANADDDIVRKAIRDRFIAAMTEYRTLLEAILAFEDEQTVHPHLVETANAELGKIVARIDEGTNRWGGLDEG